MLKVIQDHLQSIYRIQAPDVRPFLVDAAAVTNLLGPDARGADEWVLLRQDGEDVDLAVYIAEEHLQRLAQAQTPGQAVQQCFSSFCAATEGVSHFLMLIERARREEPIRMLELELQAEIDKFVSAWLHHPRRHRQLLRQLFHDAALRPDLSVVERDRYREAGRLAAAYCACLEALPHPAAVLAAVRQFWRWSGAQRLERVRRLAA
ncbi:MAG: hypothetical protein ACI8RZ_001575 [Myxococcota bacterium]|jgi:hypothetical protein